MILRSHNHSRALSGLPGIRTFDCQEKDRSDIVWAVMMLDQHCHHSQQKAVLPATLPIPFSHGSLPTFLEGSMLYFASYRKFPLHGHLYPIVLFACSICPSGNPSRLFSPGPDPLYMASAASTSLHIIYHDFPPVKNYSRFPVSPAQDCEPQESRGQLCLVLTQGLKPPTQLS